MKPLPRKPKGNEPNLDLKPALERILGVDLTTIDGINVMTAHTILAEIGPDMSAFPDEDHFTSWLGLAPTHKITGGKRIGRENRKVQNRVAGALRTAAMTLKQSSSWLGGLYRHYCRTLPSKRSAAKATARHLAVQVYRLMTKGQAWVDRGVEQFERRRQEFDLAMLTSRAQAKGFKLVPVQPEN